MKIFHLMNSRNEHDSEFGPVVIHPDLNASATCSTSSSVISGGENGIFIIYTSFLFSLKQCNFHSFFRIFFIFSMLFFKCRLIYFFRFFECRNNLSQHFFRLQVIIRSTSFLANILEGIEIRLGVDYFANKNEFDDIASKVIYTGPINRKDYTGFWELLF